ncbi:hypothetical protein HDU93_005487, partial [Gonapodya sp. JEL0774]
QRASRNPHLVTAVLERVEKVRRVVRGELSADALEESSDHDEDGDGSDSEIHNGTEMDTEADFAEPNTETVGHSDSTPSLNLSNTLKRKHQDVVSAADSSRTSKRPRNTTITAYHDPLTASLSTVVVTEDIDLDSLKFGEAEVRGRPFNGRGGWKVDDVRSEDGRDEDDEFDVADYRTKAKKLSLFEDEKELDAENIGVMEREGRSREVSSVKKPVRRSESSRIGENSQSTNKSRMKGGANIKSKGGR